MSGTAERLRELWLRQPLGSMNKRELELLLLALLLEEGCLPMDAASLSERTGITLSKAHGYLTDIALRQPVISDDDAFRRLIQLLRTAEVVQKGMALKFPVQDAALRLWIERKLARENLLQGETLRKDVVELSAGALASLLCASSLLPKPAQAAKQLKPLVGGAGWFSPFEKQARQGVDWGTLVKGVEGGAAVFKLLAEFITLG